MANYSSAFSTPSQGSPYFISGLDLSDQIGIYKPPSTPSVQYTFPSSSSFKYTTSQGVQPQINAPAKPGFGQQLAEALIDPLSKAGYALGYKVSSGRFPTAEESGLFEEESESKDFNALSKIFMEKYIKDIIDPKKPGSNDDDDDDDDDEDGGYSDENKLGSTAFGSGFNLFS